MSLRSYPIDVCRTDEGRSARLRERREARLRRESFSFAEERDEFASLKAKPHPIPDHPFFFEILCVGLSVMSYGGMATRGARAAGQPRVTHRLARIDRPGDLSGQLICGPIEA
jgi:hypothetical protein